MGACVVTVRYAANAPIFQSNTAVSARLNCRQARSQIANTTGTAGLQRCACPLVQVAQRRPVSPPAGRPSPTASSRSNTSTSLGGYNVGRLFQKPIVFEARANISYNLKFVY